MSTPEIQYFINSLPLALVKTAEDFHIKCLQHLAAAQNRGQFGWDDPSNINAINEALDKAAKEGDWTSVSNYAMMLNYHNQKGSFPPSTAL